MTRHEELTAHVERYNKGLHYLKWVHETDFVKELCEEIDQLRNELDFEREKAYTTKRSSENE